MPELGLFGSLRGVPGNGHPYRDQHLPAVTGVSDSFFERRTKAVFLEICLPPEAWM